MATRKSTTSKRSAPSRKASGRKARRRKFDRMVILVDAAKLRERAGFVIVDARRPPGSAALGEGGCQVRWRGDTATCTIGGCRGEKICAPKYIGVGRIRIYWCACEKINGGDPPVEFEPGPGVEDEW